MKHPKPWQVAATVLAAVATGYFLSREDGRARASAAAKGLFIAHEEAGMLRVGAMWQMGEVLHHIGWRPDLKRIFMQELNKLLKERALAARFHDNTVYTMLVIYALYSQEEADEVA